MTSDLSTPRTYWAAAGIVHGTRHCTILTDDRMTTSSEDPAEVMLAPADVLYSDAAPYLACVCVSSLDSDSAGRDDRLAIDDDLDRAAVLESVRLDIIAAKTAPSYENCTELRIALATEQLPDLLASQAHAVLRNAEHTLFDSFPWYKRRRALIAELALANRPGGLLGFTEEPRRLEDDQLRRIPAGGGRFASYNVVQRRWLEHLATVGCVDTANTRVLLEWQLVQSDTDHVAGTWPRPERIMVDPERRRHMKARRAEYLRIQRRWLQVTEAVYEQAPPWIVFAHISAIQCTTDSLPHEILARADEVRFVGHGHWLFVHLNALLAETWQAADSGLINVTNDARTVRGRWTDVADLAWTLFGDGASDITSAWKIAHNIV